MLRVASAGADPNIATPIVVHNVVPRRPALPVARPVAYSPPNNLHSVPVAQPIAPAPAPVALNEENHPPGHFLVMIDPGHGGYDPGTQSSAGAMEKDLALQIATGLKTALEARGIRAELTRSSDVFISLAERTRIANSAGADLFVSIHLNSSPNPDTTGIEVYYLNNTTDRATIRLARMENGGADGYGTPNDSNLNYILTDMRQSYKAIEAASLARRSALTNIGSAATSSTERMSSTLTPDAPIRRAKNGASKLWVMAARSLSVCSALRSCGRIVCASAFQN